MRIDFATLAFGYIVKVGGGTPNWATSLGQGKEYKINNNSDIDELLKGMIYTSVPLSKVTSKIGKGGRTISGNADESPIVIASLFSKVYINDELIHDGRYVMLITRDTSKSHEGRLRFKYGTSNTYTENNNIYSNDTFWRKAKKQLGLEENACFFVYDISVENQDELRLATIIVDPSKKVEYVDSTDLHVAWDILIEEAEGKRGRIIDKTLDVCEVNNIDIEGKNILYYGVPGSGKSYTIKNICSDETVMQRVVFHPDYTYSDFVGQIMPRVKGDKLEYVFLPGPFTKILDKAYHNPSKMHYLVIEEINRGNAPAIFGEMFQLLDRNDDESKGLVGESEYGISNYEIAKEVYDDPEHLVKIPANLSILATMNTSDQNVFTLDTAFQRRWELRHIKNNVLEAKHANNKIEDSEITWGAFASVINDKIDDISFDMSGLEDKRLGAYFAKEDELRKGKFPEKVLKYLWDDAFKMDKEAIFNDNIKSFDNLLSIYEDATPDKLKWILNYDVYGKMLNKVNKADEEKEDNN